MERVRELRRAAVAAAQHACVDAVGAAEAQAQAQGALAAQAESESSQLLAAAEQLEAELGRLAEEVS